MERFERSDGGRDGLSDTRCLAVKCLELVVGLVVATCWGASNGDEYYPKYYPRPRLASSLGAWTQWGFRRRDSYYIIVGAYALCGCVCAKWVGEAADNANAEDRSDKGSNAST
jgi:hypothetical protein